MSVNSPQDQKNQLEIEKIQLSYFDLFPDELILYIFTFLSPFDIPRLALTSQHFKSISEDEKLWQYFTTRYFPYASKILSGLDIRSQRAAFKSHFGIDQKFFPTLKSKKQIFNAFEGKISDISQSNEDVDTKMSLLATAAAKGHATGLHLLDEAGKGLALVLATRDENLSLMEAFYSGINKPSGPLGLAFINLIHKALLHLGNIQALSYALENCKLKHAYFDRQMLMQALERYGVWHEVTQKLLSLINQRRCRTDISPLKLSSQLLLTQEAFLENKCIEILSIGLEEETTEEGNREEIIMRLISNSFAANHTITDSDEKAELRGISRNRFSALSTLAIQHGYAALVKNLLALNHMLTLEEYSSLCIYPATLLTHSDRKALIIQRTAEKGYICALQRGDINTLRRLNSNYSISSTIKGKAFVYAATHSQLDILTLLLGENINNFDKKFVCETFRKASDEVMAHLAKFDVLPSNVEDLIRSLSQSLILSQQPPLHSHGSEETQLEKFFDKETSQAASFEDLNEPTTLVFAFNHYRKERNLSLNNNFNFTKKSGSSKKIKLSP